MAAAAAAALVLVLAGFRWYERTRAAPDAAVSLAGPGTGARAEAPPTRTRVFVHVAGEVRRPGVYALPRGARGGDALERAGGPRRRADLAAVNLAAVLEDGQQLVVPLRAAGGGAPAAAGGTTAPAEKVRLGTATVAQLEELDGIGPALAARIVEYRDAQGGFRSVDELAEVEGIGDKRLESLRAAVAP